MKSGTLSTLLQACSSFLFPKRRRINITETHITHALRETLSRTPTSDEVDLFLNHLLNNTNDWVEDMAQNFIEDISEVASTPDVHCSQVDEDDQESNPFFSPAVFSSCPSNCPFKDRDDAKMEAEHTEELGDEDHFDFNGIIPR